MLVHLLYSKNSFTSLAKFLGRMLRTSPGWYPGNKGSLIRSSICRTSCECLRSVIRPFSISVAKNVPGSGMSALRGVGSDLLMLVVISFWSNERLKLFWKITLSGMMLRCGGIGYFSSATFQSPLSQGPRVPSTLEFLGSVLRSDQLSGTAA